MRVGIAVAVALALASFSFADNKKTNKSKKGFEVEIVSISVRRAEGRVTLDGKVKNNADRPLQGLVLMFDFLASGKEVITTKRGAVDAELMAPGDESEFHVYTQDPVRAVRVRVNCEDSAGRDYRIENAGPFPIE